MITIIKNGNVLNPNNIGYKDILLAGNLIEFIADDINISSIECNVIDASDCYVMPGFIDNHVHICGGGGEGSFKTRTPEISLTDITTAGVTTVVGVLGTDGTTRTMTNLLAKAYSLEEEGITTYVYTGSYQVPVRTIMSNITDDIVLFRKIIGVGELALSDHRSSIPSCHELTRIASEARLGGILSGKAGVINVHMGDSNNPLKPIYDVINNSSIPITQFLPTHMNRNSEIFSDAIDYAKNGGYVDFTTSTIPQFLEEGEVLCSKAVRLMLENGVNIKQITISSDGQGSLPLFDKNNNLIGLTIGKVSSVLDSMKEMYFNEKLPIDTIIKTVTSNPADILNLKGKGYIKPSYDADILIMDKNDLSVKTVIARGNVMLYDGKVQVKGNFE